MKIGKTIIAPELKKSSEETLADEVEDYRKFGGYLPTASARLSRLG